MGNFQRCQTRFPVAAAALRSRGDGTPAARIGGLIGSDLRPMRLSLLSALDVLPAFAMASQDADCLQPILAAASPRTGRSWFEVRGDLPGTGYGALCHSPEPGHLHVERVELDAGLLRTPTLFGARMPGGHGPLGRAALRRLARQALVATPGGKRRTDAWLAEFFVFSPYAGMPRVSDGEEQRACLMLLVDLVVATMLDAGVVTPFGTADLGMAGAPDAPPADRSTAATNLTQGA